MLEVRGAPSSTAPTHHLELGYRRTSRRQCEAAPHGIQVQLARPLLQLVQLVCAGKSAGGGSRKRKSRGAPDQHDGGGSAVAPAPPVEEGAPTDGEQGGAQAGGGTVVPPGGAGASALLDAPAIKRLKVRPRSRRVRAPPPTA